MVELWYIFCEEEQATSQADLDQRVQLIGMGGYVDITHLPIWCGIANGIRYPSWYKHW